MKKLSILICAVLLATVAQAADVPVVNADFDQADNFNKPAGWSSFRFDQDFWWGDLDGNGVATGKYGVAVGQTLAGAQIKTGYRYTLSFDATMADGGGMYVFPVLFAVNSEGGLAYLNKSSLYPDIYIGDLSDGLQTYSIGVNAPAEQDGQGLLIRLYIMSYNGDWDSTVYIDNVRLEEWLPTPGDLNFDRTVNLSDFAEIVENWMDCNIMPAEVCDLEDYVLTN